MACDVVLMNCLITCQNTGSTPLWIASSKGQDAVVKTLLVAGANVDQARTVCMDVRTVSVVGCSADVKEVACRLVLANCQTVFGVSGHRLDTAVDRE